MDKLIFYKDFEEPEIESIVHIIKEKNLALYEGLCQKLKGDASFSVRKDVLEYFAESMADRAEDMEYASFLCELARNHQFSPEWYAWISEYFVATGQIGKIDFMTAISGAMERGMSLEETKKIFKDNGSELLQIYQEIYGEVSFKIAENEEEDEKREEIKPFDPAKLADGLLEIMNLKSRYMDGGILAAQKKQSEILENFHLAVSELSAYSTEVIHGWERDKEQINQMTVFYRFQKRLISIQQERIKEMGEEIEQLNAKLYAAEKLEQRRVEISKRIQELQTLASGDSNHFTVFLEEGKPC